MVKSLISIFYGSEESPFEVSGYKLPITVGGAGKLLISNLHTLKNKDYDMHLILLGGEEKFCDRLENITIKNISLGKNKYNFNLIKMMLNKPCLGIKDLNQDKTITLVYGLLILALLIKLLNPHSKVYLFFASSIKGNLWAYGHKNILIKMFFSLGCLFSLLLVDKIIVDKKDIILFNSPMHILRRKVYYIPNSIDVKVFSPNTEDRNFSIRRVNNNDKILLYVGRLDDEVSKNPELLFRSFKLVSERNENIKLVIIGVSDESYEQLIKKYKVKYAQNIINIGIIPNNLLPEYYRAAHLTLLTSNFEGSPFVVLESLACGTPCVITNVLDKGIIKDGINGYVSYSGKPDDFLISIEKGLLLSPKVKNQRISLLDPIYDLRYREENLEKMLKT